MKIIQLIGLLRSNFVCVYISSFFQSLLFPFLLPSSLYSMLLSSPSSIIRVLHLFFPYPLRLFYLLLHNLPLSLLILPQLHHPNLPSPFPSFPNIFSSARFPAFVAPPRKQDSRYSIISNPLCFQLLPHFNDQIARAII